MEKTKDCTTSGCVDDNSSGMKRKLHDTNWNANNYPDSSTYCRKRTFANDRLKKLRDKIKSDIVVFNTNPNPNILNTKETSPQVSYSEIKKQNYSTSYKTKSPQRNTNTHATYGRGRYSVIDTSPEDNKTFDEQLNSSSDNVLGTHRRKRLHEEIPKKMYFNPATILVKPTAKDSESEYTPVHKKSKRTVESQNGLLNITVPNQSSKSDDFNCRVHYERKSEIVLPQYKKSSTNSQSLDRSHQHTLLNSYNNISVDKLSDSTVSSSVYDCQSPYKSNINSCSKDTHSIIEATSHREEKLNKHHVSTTVNSIDHDNKNTSKESIIYVPKELFKPTSFSESFNSDRSQENFRDFGHDISSASSPNSITPSSVQKRVNKFRVPTTPNLSENLNSSSLLLNKAFMPNVSKPIPVASAHMNKCSDSKSSDKNNDKWEVSTYWMNYGQIVNSLYLKYYASNVDGNLEVGSLHNPQNLLRDEEFSMDWEEYNQPLETPSQTESPASNSCEAQELYIIVDTNIFLSDLNTLKEIVNCGSSGGTKAILYVPWMVLSELDFMKDNKNTESGLKKKVHEAVDFINKTLVKGDRKLIGQNIYEVDGQKHVGKSPDDKIISCCLQAKVKFKNIILLSNDVNLKNKILVNDIPAISTSEFLQVVSEKSSANNKISVPKNEQDELTQKVLDEMSNCCSFIICECAKDAYGAVWRKMGMLQNPPWPLNVCLRIFIKYWFAVFADKLLKQCLASIKELSRVLTHSNSLKDTDSYNDFIQCCLSLCFFLKDLEQHKEFVEGTIKEIKKITKFQL